MTKQSRDHRAMPLSLDPRVAALLAMTVRVRRRQASVRGLGRDLRGADIAQKGNQHRGEDECDHDGEKGVGVSHRRRLAIRESPELLERRLIAGLLAKFLLVPMRRRMVDKVLHSRIASQPGGPQAVVAGD